MKSKITLLIIALGISASQLFAQSHKHEIGIQTDNDSYLAQGSDRYYTNGLFLFYRQALSVPNASNSLLAGKVLGFEAGQKMYNPQTGSVPEKKYIDRPFAGYLYIASNLNLLYKNESNLKLGVQTGIIGPAALGEEAQNVIHNTFGFYPPQGWQYQIRNNFVLNLSAEYNKLLARASWIDLSANAYGNLGTAFNGAGVGAMVRAGNFNQLFSSVSTQSTASNTGIAPLHPYEFFAYYKPAINYAGYDATIQGNIFSNHTSSDEVTLTPKHWVLSNQVGIAYAGPRWILDASVIFHTKEVESMVKAHQWGAVTALYRFK